MREFIEQQIIDAVRTMLTGKVNELLREDEFSVPVIEFGDYGCGYAVSPTIVLSTCEKTEKERIIRLDAYVLTITIDLPETVESETQCYAYCDAVCRALKENPTLGGIADRARVTGEKYTPPKIPHCGDGWRVVISLRVTTEELH